MLCHTCSVLYNLTTAMLLSQSSGSSHHSLGCMERHRSTSRPTQTLNCRALLDYVINGRMGTHNLYLTMVSAQSSGHQSTDEAVLEHQHQVASGLAHCCTDSGTSSFAPTPGPVLTTDLDTPAASVPLFWQVWSAGQDHEGGCTSNDGTSLQCSPSAMACLMGLVRNSVLWEEFEGCRWNVCCVQPSLRRQCSCFQFQCLNILIYYILEDGTCS